LILVVAYDERLALEELFLATNGKKWKKNKNWMSEKNLEEWHGIKTRLMADGCRHVVEINLPGNDLSGAMTNVRFNCLVHLEQLWLSFNGKLGGTLPDSLQECSTLQKLYIQGNNNLVGSCFFVIVFVKS